MVKVQTTPPPHPLPNRQFFSLHPQLPRTSQTGILKHSPVDQPTQNETVGRGDGVKLVLGVGTEVDEVGGGKVEMLGDSEDVLGMGGDRPVVVAHLGELGQGLTPKTAKMDTGRVLRLFQRFEYEFDLFP